MSGKKDIPPQPDHAGLEVDHTRDKGYAAPEVYEKTPSYPEPVVLLKYPADLVSPEVIDSPDGVWYANGQTGNGYGHGQHGQYPYAHARGMPYEGMEVGEQPKSPWWRRKRGIFAITAVAVVVVIAIVVGAVMGTRNRNDASNTGGSFANGGGSSSNNNNGSAGSQGPKTACQDTVCPQILSAAVLGRTASPQLMVFARGVDNAVWMNSAPSSGLNTWPRSQQWQSLGGAPFLTQPSAVTWMSGTRVSVFAVTNPEHRVSMKTFTGSVANASTWKNLGGPVGTALAACTLNDTRHDLFAASGTDALHNLFTGNQTADRWRVPEDWGNVGWERIVDFDVAIASSRPGLACRQDRFYHDVIVYDPTGAARHVTYTDQSFWSPSTRLGGSFKGEPVLVAVRADRFDFFGVGTDKALYYFTWTNAAGAGPMQNLGGSFESVPSAVVTGNLDNPRIDVLALGTNHQLQHRVIQNSSPVSEWEDLGVFGNSAPLLVNLTNTTPQRVAAFVLGRGGELNQTMWTVSRDLSWKNLVWTSMGGNLTTEFHVADGAV